MRRKHRILGHDTHYTSLLSLPMLAGAYEGRGHSPDTSSSEDPSALALDAASRPRNSSATKLLVPARRLARNTFAWSQDFDEAGALNNVLCARSIARVKSWAAHCVIEARLFSTVSPQPLLLGRSANMMRFASHHRAASGAD